MFALGRTTLVAIATCLIFGCTNDNLPSVADPTLNQIRLPKPAPEDVDLSKMPPLGKGRVQDGATAINEPNHVVNKLVANGKTSIPFLISKLDDETDLERPVINFWYQSYVGDVALIVLFDLFSDRAEKPTIPGFAWDEFLERGTDRTTMGEEVLRRYIRKHGRQKIKQRWKEMWEKNKDRINWDPDCYCFNTSN